MFGCEVAVDVDVPFDKPSLVINSVFDPGSTWIAYIGQNRHILDTAIRQVEHALVVVYVNDNPTDTLTHVERGFYKSDHRPGVGVEYELRVSAPQFESAKGLSSAPAPAQIIEASKGPDIYQDGKIITTMQIRFKDDPAVENFYELSVETVQDQLSNAGDITELKRATLIETDDPLGQINGGDETFAIQFKDILFNGKEKTLLFRAIDGDFTLSKSVVWTLKTISKDLYEYRTTVNAQKLSADNPFAQPVNVHNNIQNGFGIFAGVSSSTYALTKPKPMITSVNPTKAKVGDIIFITGENLSDDHFGTQVLFSSINPYFASPPETRINDSGIEVVIPSDAVSGKIFVSTVGGIAGSNEEVEIVE